MKSVFEISRQYGKMKYHVSSHIMCLPPLRVRKSENFGAKIKNVRQKFPTGKKSGRNPMSFLFGGGVPTPEENSRYVPGPGPPLFLTLVARLSNIQEYILLTGAGN